MDVGFDHSSGAFHERLDFTGSPILSAPRRTMVQGRQIFVYARAAALGWSTEGEKVAIRATDTLIDKHWCPDGQPGWIFSVSADGSASDATRDAYTHAFALYGLAWAYGLQADPRYLDIADQTFAFIDRHLSCFSFGGLLDKVGGKALIKRQNPHMHMFEAVLAWYDVTGEDRFLARADDIFRLFETRLFQPLTSMLPEEFDETWQPSTGPMGRAFEPGHHFEWIWLLHKYSRQTGRDVHRFTDALFRKATESGFSNGLIVGVVRDDTTIYDTSTRTWPYTEALKAVAAEHRAGRTSMREFADNMLALLESRFIGRPFAAGWIDQFNANGEPMVDFVPASTLYHIVLGLSEADRIFNHTKTTAQPV